MSTAATYSQSAWASLPMDAYAAWLQTRTIAGRPYAAKTVEQYSTMFGAFVRWLQAHSSRGLLDLKTEDLEAFTQSLVARDHDAGHRLGGSPVADPSPSEASIRTRRIYLMEIARVLEFLRAQGWREDNPARDLVQRLKRQEPMKFRNSALVTTPFRGPYLRLLEGLDAANLPWDEVRMHAMALLMLELGLTLKEVQKLTMHDLAGLGEGILRAPGHRSLRARTLAAPPVVQHWLQAWLAHRSSFLIFIARVRRKKGAAESLERTPDNLVSSPSLARVFVSLLSPRASPDERGRRLAINRIDDRSIRHAANTALSMAAPDWPSGIVHGPQMLRNLCFQRWVRAHPEDEEMVAQMMGLSDVQQVRWMARLMGVGPASDSPRFDVGFERV